VADPTRAGQRSTIDPTRRPDCELATRALNCGWPIVRAIRRQWAEQVREVLGSTTVRHDAPVLLRRRSAIRRDILDTYGMHAIKDRERVRRWLPKLYVAHCRRLGYGGDCFWIDGKPTPAMRITAATKPTEYPDPWFAWNHRTAWREYHSDSPARQRGRAERRHT
jgi:hypothetical protein